VIGRRTIGELRSAGRFLTGLRSFLRHPLDLTSAQQQLETQLAQREASFRAVVQHAIFDRPASPYRRLFEWAGITFGDVDAMLVKDGLDATLERVCDAGVRLTLEEFKGWRPIQRPGLDMVTHAEDFDNPLTPGQYEVRTGGSTSAPRRIVVDLNLLAHESAYHALFYQAAGASDHALGIWQPAPPGAVGIKTALMQAKLGRATTRWFSQSRSAGSSLKHALFARAAVYAATMHGARIPVPEFTPPHDAIRVARWLAQEKAKGRAAILVTPASAGVRVARAAVDHAEDIAGTLFILGGEPYTDAKARVIGESGSVGYCHYAMVEAGIIGVACLAADTTDDVHLAVDKIATIQRDKVVSSSGTVVKALFHTTLLPFSPKIMLNVESGDYGSLVDRPCGCGALPSGFRRHLHSIRSYEKLTSEGMSFLGSDLLTLIEDVLPRRFGGRPTDYQLLERERDGLPRVSLVVSPAVGTVDETAVVRAALDFLRARGIGEAMMADLWARSDTLQVVRQDTYVTPGGKILPLETQSHRR
jgi:hypothetical protein